MATAYIDYIGSWGRRFAATPIPVIRRPASGPRRAPALRPLRPEKRWRNWYRAVPRVEIAASSIRPNLHVGAREAFTWPREADQFEVVTTATPTCSGLARLASPLGLPDVPAAPAAPRQHPHRPYNT